MSWVTSISSWRSIQFRFSDVSVANLVVRKKAYTAIAVLSLLDDNKDLQFHEFGTVFLDTSSYDNEKILSWPVGTSIICQATSDDDCILTFVRHENGWLLTVTPVASSPRVPTCTHRDYFVNFPLDKYRWSGHMVFAVVRDAWKGWTSVSVS